MDCRHTCGDKQADTRQAGLVAVTVDKSQAKV